MQCEAKRELSTGQLLWQRPPSPGEPGDRFSLSTSPAVALCALFFFFSLRPKDHKSTLETLTLATHTFVLRHHTTLAAHTHHYKLVSVGITLSGFHTSDKAL